MKRVFLKKRFQLFSSLLMLTGLLISQNASAHEHTRVYVVEHPVHPNHPWYHHDHVYIYNGNAYPNYYAGYPYYFYDPRYYYNSTAVVPVPAGPAPAASVNVNLNLGG